MARKDWRKSPLKSNCRLYSIALGLLLVNSLPARGAEPIVTEPSPRSILPVLEINRLSTYKLGDLEPIPQKAIPTLTAPQSPVNSVTPQFRLVNGNSIGAELQWTSGRPDGHAPIGVMADHTHEEREWMFSYRYMFMDMDGNRDGTDQLSDADVLENFPVTPQRMTMKMHMVGFMFAPTDDFTLMAMLPYIYKEMDHINRMGVTFRTNTQGPGDLKLSGLYNVMRQNRQSLHLNAGVSFPTGSINERDDTPAGSNVRLPYPMQLGSGTIDLLPGITYLGQADSWSWGAQAMGVLRLGENDEDYRLGNQLNLTSWFAGKWTDWLSTSVRLNGKTWGNIRGNDPLLNPAMVPTADPDRRSGTRLDLGLGLNLYAPSLQGGRLAVEFELPIYQSLEGPQLETDWQLTVGAQAVF